MEIKEVNYDERNFDALLGASREQVVNYFGKPDADMFSMMYFCRNTSVLILKLNLSSPENGEVSKEMVQGYIFVLPEHAVLAKGIALISKEEVQKIKKDKSIRSILEEFGSQCEMYGSTFERPLFFTDYGTVVILITQEDMVRQIKEFTVHEFLYKNEKEK